MMKNLRKGIIFAVIWQLVFGGLPTAWAQIAPYQIPEDEFRPLGGTRRAEGSSFGTREEQKAPRKPYMSPGFMFPKSTSGALGLMYQVHILGEVQNPGTYRVPASSRLSEAIGQAGNILKGGSSRRIELRRTGRNSQIDLFSFQVLGDLNGNPYLRDNDTVFVPLKDKVVQVTGAVKRPGEYEIFQEKNIEDLIKLAGGVSPGAAKFLPIRVVRYDENGKKRILIVANSKEDRKDFLVNGADVIVVPHVLTAKNKFDYNLSQLPGDRGLFYPSFEERVFVLGGVYRPGPYSFSPYYDVRRYLTVAGGKTKLAKKDIQIIRIDGTVSKSIDTQINPGDAIYVPEKYLAPESIISLVLGVATSILGITTTVFALTR